MNKLKLIKKEGTFQKATRECGICRKAYEVSAFFGMEYFTLPLECDSCHHIAWYDFYEDKLFDEVDKKYQNVRDDKERHRLVWGEILDSLPNCAQCKGKYKKYDWYSYGAPDHCPHCRASQSSNGTALDKRKIQSENKVKTVKETSDFFVSYEK